MCSKYWKSHTDFSVTKRSISYGYLTLRKLDVLSRCKLVYFQAYRHIALLEISSLSMAFSERLHWTFAWYLYEGIFFILNELFHIDIVEVLGSQWFLAVKTCPGIVCRAWWKLTDVHWSVNLFVEFDSIAWGVRLKRFI